MKLTQVDSSEEYNILESKKFIRLDFYFGATKREIQKNTRGLKFFTASIGLTNTMTRKEIAKGLRMLAYRIGKDGD
jgi:hypothetical protein